MTSLQKKCLVITGMHRSHSSLMAEVVATSGLFLGPDLIGADSFNPRGHFEESSIVNFHREMISSNRFNDWWKLVDGSRSQEWMPTKAERDRACTTILSAFPMHTFGWKDPRAVFFLEFWNNLLADCYFLFLVRNPAHCVQSLMRRSLKNTRIKFKPLWALRYLNLWEESNRQIYLFALRYPRKTLIVHTMKDLEDKSTRFFIDRKVRSEWQFELSPLSFEECIKPEFITSAKETQLLKTLLTLKPQVPLLYKKLVSISAGPISRSEATSESYD